MEDKLMLPVGISDFREIRESNYFYVDKTSIIKELLDTGAKATLITRPRRFGKTLAMTMIRDFFDITQESKEIFNGLSIMDSQYASEINSTPVIFLTFKECKGNIDDALSCVYSTLLGMLDNAYAFRDKIKNVLDLEKLVRIKTILSDYDYSKKAQLVECILLLSKIYYQHYGKKAVVLIDEYDTPMISAYEQDYYDEIKNFFNRLYGNALKDNPYLQFAVMTGIHRIAKENIFSGLNHLEVCTVTDSPYSAAFGLTEEETKVLLDYYDLELTIDVKRMYNGYRFAGTEIYNPWSIIKYARMRKLLPYWINTSTNLLVRQLIANAKTDFLERFETLIGLGTADVEIDMSTSFFELQQEDSLWGLLVSTGYITVLLEPEELYDLYTIGIPNWEVLGEFKKIVAAYTGFGETPLKELFRTLLRKDIEGFIKVYRDIILTNTSFYDSRENAYHMLVLGMCVYLQGFYDVESNIEAGHGRSDIMLISGDEKNVHVIMEFKQGENTEQLALDALKQIHDKQYYAGLSGEVLLLGIAHDKKKCDIVSELYIAE